MHYKLYFDLSGIPHYPPLLLATFTDAIIISVIFIIISFKHGNAKWISKPKGFDYFLIILFELLTAIIIEVWALSIGRWAYKSAMPLIFGIGLSPLLQLGVTGILCLFVVRKII